MRTRTLTAATALAVLFGSTALAVTSAAPALADSSTVLPVTSTGDVVVDGAHQRVFISDPKTGKVVATDYSGTVLGTWAPAPLRHVEVLHLHELRPDASRSCVERRGGTWKARVAGRDRTAVVPR